MVVRGGSLTKSMSQYLIDQIHATKNIEVRTHCSMLEVKGEKQLEAIVIGNSVTNEKFFFDHGSSIKKFFQ